MFQKIKGIGWVIIGFILMLCNYLFTTPVKTSTAVLQLEDSDVLYGIGMRGATSGVLSEILFYVPLLMIVIGIGIFVKSKSKEKIVNEEI